jgi:hypothetical protein
MANLPFLQARKGSWTGAYVPLGIVDQRPWQTAATLAGLAQEQGMALNPLLQHLGELPELLFLKRIDFVADNASDRHQRKSPRICESTLRCKKKIASNMKYVVYRLTLH